MFFRSSWRAIGPTSSSRGRAFVISRTCRYGRVMQYDYDVLVIGSGFGGSVSALRLVEKGYRVGVLEAGRRFADEDFPATSWQVRDYLFAPALGCYGIFRMTPLKNALVLAGAGVGGGSL